MAGIPPWPVLQPFSPASLPPRVWTVRRKGTMVSPPSGPLRHKPLPTTWLLGLGGGGGVGCVVRATTGPAPLRPSVWFVASLGNRGGYSCREEGGKSGGPLLAKTQAGPFPLRLDLSIRQMGMCTFRGLSKLTIWTERLPLLGLGQPASKPTCMGHRGLLGAHGEWGQGSGWLTS